MRSFFLLTAAAAVIPFSANADDHLADEVIVTSTRLLVTQSEAGTSVSVISADDIEIRGLTNIGEVLASAPGVTVNSNGGFGGQSAARIRGGATGHTLVLVDGVPVNDTTSPAGGYDFAHLGTANIERVEVLKGAQSTLWGSDAIGGVVSIISKTPADGLSGQAFGEAGSFSTFRGGASAAYGDDGSYIQGGATILRSDGISKADEIYGNTEADGYENNSYYVKGRYDFGAAALSAHLRYIDADTDFDSFAFVFPGVADGADTAESKELTARAAGEFSLFDGRLDNEISGGWTDIDRQNFSGGAPTFGADGAREIYRYQGNLQIADNHRTAFGAEHEKTRSGNDTADITGIFALYEARFAGEVILTGGIRHDDHSEFGGETTGRVAANWTASEIFTLSASWGQGFRAPSLFQTTFFCCGAMQPNPNLQPETSNGFDVGLSMQIPGGRGELSVTYFDQSTKNLIDFDFAAGGYINVALADASGLEVSGSFDVADWARLDLNFAHTDVVDGNGTPLIRIPENTGDAALTLSPLPAVSLSAIVRYNGEEQDTQGLIEDWTRIDLTARYAISDAIELYGSIENLFDIQYQQLLGYGTPGLSGRAGLRAKF